MQEVTKRATARPALTPRRWEFVRQYVALGNGSAEADRLGVTPARVLGELASIAFADFGDYVRLVDGVPIFDMSELPAGATRAIASIDETSSGVRFKLHDKQAALATLAQSFGLLGNDSPAVSVVVGASFSSLLSSAASAAVTVSAANSDERSHRSERGQGRGRASRPRTCPRYDEPVFFLRNIFRIA